MVTDEAQLEQDIKRGKIGKLYRFGTRDAKLMKGHFTTFMAVCRKCSTRKPETESSLVIEIYCAKRSSSGMVALDYLVWMLRE